MYTVTQAPDCLAVDTNAKLNAAQCKTLATSGLTLPGENLVRPIKGVCRYVSLHTPEPVSDIDSEELSDILNAGLGLWLVQHCLNPGWVATEALGMKLGAAAYDNAKAAGYAAGAHLALDLEGCATIGHAVVDFVEAWCAQLAGEYLPLLYVGYACGLSPDQLYEALPSVHLYWSDFGPRTVSVRGFAIKQHAQTAVHGIPVDPDVLSADNLGDRLMWMTAADYQ